MPKNPDVPPGTWHAPLAPVTDKLREADDLPGPWTGCSTWAGETVDYQTALLWMWRDRGDASDGG